MWLEYSLAHLGSFGSSEAFQGMTPASGNFWQSAYRPPPLLAASGEARIGLPRFWQLLARRVSASPASGNFWRGTNRPPPLLATSGEARIGFPRFWQLLARHESAACVASSVMYIYRVYIEVEIAAQEEGVYSFVKMKRAGSRRGVEWGGVERCR